MRALLIFVPAVLMAQSPPARPATAKPKPVAAQALATDEEKAVYALGLSVYRSLGRFDLSPDEIKIVQRAISDAAAGKPAIDAQEWAPKVQELARTRALRAVEREKAASEAYLEKAAMQPGVVRTESGLIYREVHPGAGPSPKATDTVKVNYRGTLVNGSEFDSSYRRNQPAEFPLNRVIPCWTEGLQKMKVGGKAVLVCPSKLAYGDGGSGPIPGGATLIFEVELLGIVGQTP